MGVCVTASVMEHTADRRPTATNSSCSWWIMSFLIIIISRRVAGLLLCFFYFYSYSHCHCWVLDIEQSLFLAVKPASPSRLPPFSLVTALKLKGMTSTALSRNPVEPLHCFVKTLDTLGANKIPEAGIRELCTEIESS